MEEKEKYIGVMIPAPIANALYDKKKKTGISVTHQVVKSLEKTLKIKGGDHGTLDAQS